MKYYGFLVILFIAQIEVIANTISGTVTDEDGIILTGVAVKFEDLKIGTITDNKGYYSVSLPKTEHKLVFSFLGYSDYSVIVCDKGKSITLDVTMEVTSVDLNEITVVGKTRSQLIKEAPGSISILDSQELQGRAVSLEAMVGRCAGVKVAQQGGLGSSSKIFIQGLTGKQITVFVNGIPMGTIEDFSLSSIPVDMIERVEIYKGIIPSWLCSDGLGGAINIISKQHPKNLEASYETGSYNTHKITVLSRNDIKKSGISINAGGYYNYSDNNYTFNSPFNDGLVITRDNDTYRDYNLSIDIGFTKLWFDRLDIGLSYSNIYKEIQGGLIYEQGNVQHAHLKTRLFHSNQNLFKKLANDKLTLSLNSVVGYTVFNQIDTSHYCYNFDGTSYESPSVQGEVGILPNDSHDTRWDVKELLSVGYHINEHNNLNWNTVFQYSEKMPQDELADYYASFETSGYKSNHYSIVSGLGYELKLFDNKLTNNLSGKYFMHHAKVVPSNEFPSIMELSIVTNKSSNFGWNEALAWKPFKKQITFKVSVQQSVRIPTADEIFGDQVIIYPATDLKPERSFNFNFGVNWLINPSGYPNLRLDINTFYMMIHDKIKLLTSVIQMGYQNIDEVESKGIELELNSELSSWCSFSGNFAYNDARNVLKYTPGTTVDNPKYGLRVPNTPYLFGNAGIKFHKNNLFLKKTNSIFFYEGQFTEKYYYNWKVSNNQSLLVPRCLSFNTGIRQTFKNNRLSVSFEIHNLTDKEIWGQFLFPIPGRTFHLKIKYQLLK